MSESLGAGLGDADPGRAVPGRSAAVLVASTRAAAGAYDDRTGPVIVGWLRERGFHTQDATVVPDGPLVGAALRAAVAARLSLVITTGGTGVSPTDVTADATAEILDREVPGFMEELRRRGAAHTPTALLTRGRAGVAERTFVVNLPGSPGGVRDGLQLLGEVLDHVLDQIAGGAHDD
ncbi:MogA/MoaB family molybdenum cofactor biosynthesis protein [Planctomonas psychrotolerans]|uniref:MogA/MoaB family molybdenum cofactor biosynthesis protein n=1 Tax=Planctomonas psychrotolerans TaxID=2528712 RepID=UPI001D0D6EFC|nr:MogA/MoaB family molybdenum cofactor biosynthesis protein [Planctomonas psychrotolerans]